MLLPPPRSRIALAVLPLVALAALGCAGVRRSGETYHDPNMDFGLIQRIAVLPFANLSPVSQAGERVRDVFMGSLQATGSVYVLPPGEVARGVSRTRILAPASPTGEEVIALGKEVKVDVVITGTVREYGEVRSGNASANAVSVSIEMIETQSGKVVFSTSATAGGISTADRLLGGRGEPMSVVTETAVRDLVDRMFAGH
jgi:polysaccharide biosynthesis protein PelC